MRMACSFERYYVGMALPVWMCLTESSQLGSHGQLANLARGFDSSAAGCKEISQAEVCITHLLSV